MAAAKKPAPKARSKGSANRGGSKGGGAKAGSKRAATSTASRVPKRRPGQRPTGAKAPRRRAGSTSRPARSSVAPRKRAEGPRRPPRAAAPEVEERQSSILAGPEVASVAPEVAPVPAAPEAPDPSRPRAEAIAKAGLDKKAEDVVVLDVRGLTSYADYFVLLTAESDRQASAIADAIDEAMRRDGADKVGVEGYESGRWILVDYGDVVAHVFSREARGFYDLEGLWADAPRVAVSG